jgi:hypothetical protein
MNNVFIIGAGASKLSGAPLMKNFFDKAEKVRNRFPLKDDIKKKFDLVFDARAKLQQIYSKSYIDLHNIESFFGIIEMSKILDNEKKIFKCSLNDLADSIKIMIVYTLSYTIQFPSNEGRKTYYSSPELFSNDILNWPSFLSQMMKEKKENPAYVSRIIWDLLPTNAKSIIDNMDNPSNLSDLEKEEIIKSLNLIIHSNDIQSIIDARYDVSSISSQKQIMMNNRFNIEYAFPTQIAKIFYKFLPPKPYYKFIEEIFKYSKDNQSTFISFNYDLSLDYTLLFMNKEFNYCLREDEKNESIQLLKLHGSINWFKCTKCNNLIPQKRVLRGTCFVTDDKTLSENSYLLAYQLVEGQCCPKCSEILSVIPFIVPPTLEKTRYHKEIKNVWKKAADVLSKADNIFVIGYSLPETDIFFKYLYSIGSMSDHIIKNFVVYDPDTKVHDRFLNFIGGSVKDRFVPVESFFENAFEIIDETARPHRGEYPFINKPVEKNISKFLREG